MFRLSFAPFFSHIYGEEETRDFVSMCVCVCVCVCEREREREKAREREREKEMELKAFFLGNVTKAIWK